MVASKDLFEEMAALLELTNNHGWPDTSFPPLKIHFLLSVSLTVAFLTPLLSPTLWLSSQRHVTRQN